MRVVATKKGFHLKVREIGEVFEVPEGSKASWFKPSKVSVAKPVEGPENSHGKRVEVEPGGAGTDLT